MKMNLKTYAEKSGKQPFNWLKELSVNCKEMSWQKAKALVNRSQEWTTCATGNQCAIIPRVPTKDKSHGGEPYDRELRELGFNFYRCGILKMYQAIQKKDFAYANEKRKESIEILQNIEKRSADLIVEITRQSKDVLKQLGYKIQKVA